MLEDMLRACSLDWQGSWDDQLPWIELEYNNSSHLIRVFPQGACTTPMPSMSPRLFSRLDPVTRLSIKIGIPVRQNKINVSPPPE